VLAQPVQRYGRRKCKETLVFLITCFSSRFETAQRLRRVVPKPVNVSPLSPTLSDIIVVQYLRF
jgi:hypothetical protein